jgi:hypothetical protein
MLLEHDFGLRQAGGVMLGVGGGAGQAGLAADAFDPAARGGGLRRVGEEGEAQNARGRRHRREGPGVHLGEQRLALRREGRLVRRLAHASPLPRPCLALPRRAPSHRCSRAARGEAMRA